MKKIFRTFVIAVSIVVFFSDLLPAGDLYCSSVGNNKNELVLNGKPDTRIRASDADITSCNNDALEFGFQINANDSTKEKKIRTHEKYRQISFDVYKDKVEGSWIGQAIGALWGYYTEAKWSTSIMPFGFTDYTIFNEEVTAKVWKEKKVWDSVLVGMNEYKNILSNWETYEPESMKQQDELFLEFLFLHTLQQKGLNVTSRQYAEDWAAFLDSTKVAAANNLAAINFSKGIWPPYSGMPQNNLYFGAIDFQIECELFGLIAPGMIKSVKEQSIKAGQLMSFDEGLEAGVAIAAITSESFFESDPVKLMEYGIASLPSDSKYAAMMRTILDESKHYKKWEDLWTFIQGKSWRKNEINPRYDVRIEGAYVFIGLLYGGGDFLKSMNITMRCGEDSDSNPASTAGILGTICGISKLPGNLKKIRNLTVDNSAIKTIYPKSIKWEEILDATIELGKLNVIKNGGYIEKGIMYIPVQK